jgi:deoxyribonuclease V
VIVAVDVDYKDSHSVVATVGFRAWTDERPAFERVVRVPGAPAAYVAGQFYLRELPCLLAGLRALDALPTVIVVDGYVRLAKTKPGLGAHLHDALFGKVAVVGVAKTEFHGAPAAKVLRGASKKPLFVTVAGMSLDEAAEAVRSMHGPHRIPTLLARADRLCRDPR